MKKVILLITFAFANLAVVAQDTLVTMSKNRYLNFDIAAGYMQTDLRKINSFFTGYGYKSLPGGSMTLSFSPSFFVNRFVFRGEYTGQLPVTVEQSENRQIDFTGNHISASFGYVIAQRPGYRLFAYAGVSAFVSQFSVNEKIKATSLDNLVNSQPRSFHLAYSNASVDLGLQFDKLIAIKNSKWDCPQNARFMTLGIRAGYLLGPGKVTGRFNEAVVPGAPTYSPNGPYVKLVMGFTNKVRDLNWKK